MGYTYNGRACMSFIFVCKFIELISISIIKPCLIKPSNVIKKIMILFCKRPKLFLELSLETDMLHTVTHNFIESLSPV